MGTVVGCARCPRPASPEWLSRWMGKPGALAYAECERHATAEWTGTATRPKFGHEERSTA